MSNAARVDSVDAIRGFRVALVKFLEVAQAALTESESDISRKQMWLETEQDQVWSSAIRKFQEQVSRAKEAVRMKKIFKDSFGRTQSAVEEEKTLRLVQARLADAETKLAATRAHARQLQREQLLYRGQVQRLQTALSGDIPNAVALLANIVKQLDAYAAEAPVEVVSDALTTSSADTSTMEGSSMRRSSDEPVAPSQATAASTTKEKESAENPAENRILPPTGRSV